MKNKIITIIMTITIITTLCLGAYIAFAPEKTCCSTYVKGYTRKDGTEVDGYCRSVSSRAK